MTTFEAAKIRAVVVRACIYFGVPMCLVIFYPTPVPDGKRGCLLGTYMDGIISVYGEPDQKVVLHEIAHHVHCCREGEHRRYHTRAFYKIESEVITWATDTKQF